ncbi:Spindle assembly abnormal protein 6 [Kappamyces sp. JEL0829]|nr:Spindle assembly abnormal protein 6 [Kappamyces sp. JEL0829]
MKDPSQPSQHQVYSKPVALAIKSIQAPEKTVLPVTVTIRLLGGGLKSSSLDLELTQEQDPLFLYCLSVGEEEFHQLKTEQTLLVDFGAFPGKLVELLELCIANQGSEYPKYVAQLFQDPNSPLWTFNIVETNSFKHITHLSLKFTPGNDSTTKNHLAGVVRDLKEQLASTRSMLRDTRDSYSDAQAAMAAGRKELEELCRTHQDDRNALLLSHAQDLANEKEKWIKALDETRKHSEIDGRSVRDQYEKQLRSLQEQMTSLQITHGESTKTMTSLETSLSLTQSKLNAVTLTNSTLSQEKERFLATKDHLEQSISSLSQKLDSLTLKLRESETRERDAVESKLKLQDKVDSLEGQLKREQDAVALLKSQCDRLDLDLKAYSEEISKANEIIRKLQSDSKGYKSKLKLKNVVTLQQEKLIEEKTAAMDSLGKELAAAKEAAAKHAEENDEHLRKISTLLTSLEESKKVIEDNNHVIDWLHKQLNEDALHRPVSTKQPFAPVDFNRYIGSENVKRTDKFNSLSENVKPEFNSSRTRFTSIESAGAFERASPIPAAALGFSRGPSAFSTHIPMRNKSPTNAVALQHFNVNPAKPAFSNSTNVSNAGVAKTAPKSNYF